MTAQIALLRTLWRLLLAVTAMYCLFLAVVLARSDLTQAKSVAVGTVHVFLIFYFVAATGAFVEFLIKRRSSPPGNGDRTAE